MVSGVDRPGDVLGLILAWSVLKIHCYSIESLED